MIPDMIIGAIGFDTIDSNLQNLIAQMETFPESGLLGSIQNMAKIIGLCLALGVGSYECWMMILGRRGMDVMKILHIIIISLCISMSGWIADAAKVPGKMLGDTAKQMALAKNEEVKELEKQVADAQQKYLARLDSIIQTAQMQKQAHDNYAQSQEGGLFNIDIGASIDEIKENMAFMLKKWAVALETKIVEFVSIIIRFIGEVIFQVAYYGMLVAQNIFMHLLYAFCPVAFALSLAPPFRSAWSQWLSKYISLSLWAFVIYMVLYYVNFIMLYNLNMDLTVYTGFLSNLKNTGSLTLEAVGAIGMQGLGTTCMYVVGLLVGVFCLRFVPDVASWLIPGGIGSPMGGAAVGMATGMASKAGGAVTAIGGSMGGQAGKAIGLK